MTHPLTSGTPYSNSLQCGVFLKLRILLYENFARFLSLIPIMTNTKYTSIQLSTSSKPCTRTPCEPFTATSRTTTALRWVIVWDYHHNRGVMLWIPLYLSLCFPFSSFHTSCASLVSSIITSCFYLSLHASHSLYLWLTYLVPFISDSSLLLLTHSLITDSLLSQTHSILSFP